MTGLFRILTVCLAAHLMVGCAPRVSAAEVVRSPSFAVAPDQDTTLGKQLAAGIKGHPGKSGFRLITTGTNAFQTRIALVRLAEKSLDLQYYSVQNDLTGQVMLEELLRAADRGVRIRILIDDLNIKKVDDAVTVLNLHPHIEVRGFNALATSNQPFWARFTSVFTEPGRVTKRMHNKTLIADNQSAIVGGRNLGDEYFDASSDFLFSDMDVLCAGPVVGPVSHSFDRYWNSEESYPLDALPIKKPEGDLIREVRTRLRENWEQAHSHKEQSALRDLKPLTMLEPLTWAQADVSVDPPHKVQQDSEMNESRPLTRLDQLLDHATEEFIAISPYFVPQDEGVDWLTSIASRGIKVRILTNSLASLDVAAVYAGYRRYREPLLKGGVKLYEFKPIPGRRTKQTLRGSSSRASLHAKVYVIDRKDLVISSFNLDPRSIKLNTELAVVIHSPELAAQVAKMFEDSIAPDSSYAVRLKPTSGGDSELVWITEEEGRIVERDREPPAGFWRRMTVGAFSVLPFEDQL